MACLMNKLTISLIAAILVGIWKGLGVQGQHGLFKRQTHFRADAGGRVPLWSLVTTRGVFQCIEACTGDPRCMSVLYNSETKACPLHAQHVSSAQDSLAPADWQLWERQVDGPLCPVTLGYSYRRDLVLCYKIHQDEPQKWSGAQSACEAEGGHLLVVDLQEKQDFMVVQLTSIDGNTTFGASGFQGFYLDGRFWKGVWTWMSRAQRVAFSAWFGTENERRTSVENSIIMSSDMDYLWASVDSGFLRPFVCEVDVPGPPFCGQ